jgi:hypothetical protein
MAEDDDSVYREVSYILGLKVIPGKENEIREKTDKLTGVFKSFKSLGQFDVILLVKGAKDVKSVISAVKDIENVIDVFFIELE